MSSEYFWGHKPSDHAPVIDGKQFVYVGAFFAKSRAEKEAEIWRDYGFFVRVKNKSITDQFGSRKRRVTGHVYVVFRTLEKK